MQSSTHDFSPIDYFRAYDRVTRERESSERLKRVRRTALQNYMTVSKTVECNGFKRMLKCRQALEAIDRRGWLRSFHQRLFHDNFIRACARIFWKREPHGVFAKDHQRILEVNGWDHLAQEVLVSTPRRFGKTISVSMFAAAMLYSCPNLEMSIYSTCKVRQGARDSKRAFIDWRADSESRKSCCGTSRSSWSWSTWSWAPPG